MKRNKSAYFIFFLFLFFLRATGQQSENFTTLKKVVIDAGHGGIDRGASGSIAHEKDITLKLALLAGKLIGEQMPGLEIIYTRTNDSFVPLHQRAQIANDVQADLFISIHCNAIAKPEFFGSETYVMGVHKTAENLEVAKTENAAIFLEENFASSYDGFNPDVDEDYIMLTMMQHVNMDQSIAFSQLVQEKLKSTAGMYNRGVKQAGFVVLYLTTMPGALVETGFLSNPAEEKYLLDPDNQYKIAKAIAEAVLAYKESSEK
jgi:N-acetylmuramoyl-L-alanine amidase